MDAERGSEQWLRDFHALPGGESPPAVLRVLAVDEAPELVWRNQLGGQTWRVGDRFLKWSPDAAGIDLHREVGRLHWLRGRLPAPQVLVSGRDGAGGWFLTAALPGTSAVSPRWLARPEHAVRAIADGLRRVHALPASDVPSSWQSWATRRPRALGRPPADVDPVVVHGDACVPNTLLTDDGAFSGIVDVGDLVLGDRWADLAVASMSLDWNFGPGWQPAFFDAYGVEPDEERIAYFRRLFHAES